MRRSIVFAIVAASLVSTAQASHRFLPPLVPWEGKSLNLLVDRSDPWVTPFEESMNSTPRYDETVAWLEKLVAAAPDLRMVSLGNSAQGRPIWAVIASSEGAFTPEKIRASEKATLLAHSGIHSGEIDGKDAGLMLLRDISVRGTKRDLLRKVNLIFVPIFNVDGHERFTAHGRMNQRGPKEMGWRTSPANLNFNRDYAKLDLIEMRHMVAALRAYDPDLYIDLHVTDGADYQYDITFGFNGEHGWSPSISRWLEKHYRSKVDDALDDMDHIPGPLVFAATNNGMYGGMFGWTASPRFSNGYGDAIHLPTVLVENHSLKPYHQRVLGNYVLLEASIRVLGDKLKDLQTAIREDRARRPAEIPLGFQVPADSPPPTMKFKGIKSIREESDITGGEVTRWLGEPEEIEIQIFAETEPTVMATRPKAYLVPAEWSQLADVLKAHGVEMRELDRWEKRTVEMLRLPDAKLAENPFEGHARVSAGTPVRETTQVDFAPGSFEISTDQVLGELVMLLLEPESEDSLFQWGFVLSILNRTEYFEAYVMEPMAAKMLQDPAVANKFQKALDEDPEFAADERARLEWFYKQTPYYDATYLRYPVGRVPK